jgi:3-oxoacyl-[acyl-carrier protein] reductase
MLNGKNILITGSSRGIGRATAELAVAYGAKVIVHGRTESEDLQNLAKRLSARLVVFDATDKEQVFKNIEILLKDDQKIDGLINCIGAPKVKNFWNLQMKIGLRRLR